MADSVIVCCKHPHGLVLEIDEMVEMPSAIGGGMTTMWRGTGRKVTICGSHADQPNSSSPGRVIAGYGITDVDGDFWAEWVKQKKGFHLLTNGTLFAQPTLARAASQSKEQTAIRTGLEGMPQTGVPGIKSETGGAI